MQNTTEGRDGQVPTTYAERRTQSPAASDLSKLVKVILRNWFVEPDPELEAIEVASWLRTLNGMTAKQVHSAWERYQGDGPRSNNGRLLKPTAVDIRKRIIVLSPVRTYAAHSQIERPKEPERKPVDPEVAERICQEAGFTPDHARLVKRFPSAATRQDIEDRRSLLASAKQEVRAAVDPDQLRSARLATAIGAAALEDGKARTNHEGRN